MTISINNLSGGYDDTLVIQKLTGKVSSGQIVGVFGRNGVGKTTLARLIIGELQTLSGVISIHDHSVQFLPIHERRKVGIGYLPQNFMVFDNLTVQENLILAGSLDCAEPYFVRFPKLKKRLMQKAGTMSGGERKILSFVRSMIENTTCLVLDEPSEGVQPENIKLMQECLLEKKAAGVAILLIEQNINMLENLADYYWGIESGKLIYNKHNSVALHEDIIKLLTI